jgi:hypothetical protein
MKQPIAPMCVVLTKELLDRLDAVATANGVFRSDVVRAAIFQEVAVQEAIITTKAKASDVGRAYYVPKAQIDTSKQLARSIARVIAGYQEKK